MYFQTSTAFNYRVGGANSGNITIPNYKNSWIHVVSTYSSSEKKVYVNGLEVYTGSGGATTNGDTNLQIGAYNNCTVSTNFLGLIDEVKIFPYALTEDQIKTEYNLGSASVIGEAATVAPPPNGILKDSLVAHWSFDEQAGQTVHDKVGGNDGTRGADANASSDDPTWKPAGECKVNGCESFDGGEDYVNIPSHGSEINLTDDLTMVAWIKTTSGAGDFIYSGTASSWGHRLGISAGKVTGSFIQVSPSVASETITGDIPINDGQWHHVAVVRENGSALSVYVDGTLDKTDVAQNLVLRTGTGRTIATYNSSAFFSGLIDEVKIYNTALTADQVRQDMNAGASVSYGVGQDEADDLTDGAGDPPVAEWRFDEKQGATAYDTSGNENNGTVNGATWKSACKQGACLEFDGVDDIVSVDNSDSLMPTSEMSFSLWFKPADDWSASTPRQNLIYKASAYYVIFNLYGNGKINFVTYESGNHVVETTQTTWSASQWHNISGSYDRGFLKIYVDGKLSNSLYYSGGINGSGNNLHVGSNSGNQPFNGLIDHVKIYDYARTPAQIAYDYNRGKPIAHWKFDECEGTVAHDSSGNDNHGTINIGATGSQTTAGTCETSGAWGNGAEGKFNGSLNFDGGDDYVEIDASSTQGSDTDLTERMTLAAWVKSDKTGSLSNFGMIERDDLTTNRQYNLHITSNGYLRFYLEGTSVDGTTNLNSNGSTWYHVAATWDKDLDNGEMKVYVNGQLEGSGAYVNSAISSYATSLTIGKRGGNYLRGVHEIM